MSVVIHAAWSRSAVALVKRTVCELATARFLGQAENVLIFGEPFSLASRASCRDPRRQGSAPALGSAP
jgi:hypothetical protein